MGITDRTDLYPLTESIVFLGLPFEEGVRGLRHWWETTLTGSGSDHHVVTEDVHGPLDVALRSLDPLSPWADRVLAVPTVGDRWTAWFRNSVTGTDPTSAVAFQAVLLEVRTVMVTDVPGESTVFETHPPGRWEPERSTWCVKESRWHFDLAGEPLPWEDTSTCAERRVGSRFTRAQLNAVCAGFGIDLADDGSLAPDERTVLLRRVGDKPNEVLITLAEQQAADGVRPGGRGLMGSAAFLGTGFEDGVRGLTRWLEEDARTTRPGDRVVAEEVHGPVGVALRRLEPSSTGADGWLVVPTAGDRWTAWFRDGSAGTDPGPVAGSLGRFLRVAAVAVTDRPGRLVSSTSYPPPAAGEEVDAWAREDLEPERSVSCALVAGRWSFSTVGEPAAWEDTAGYGRRDPRDCFGREQLHALCAGYGIDLDDEGFLAPQRRTVLLRLVGDEAGTGGPPPGDTLF